MGRERFRFKNSPTLFLTITNECNLNCVDCYSKFKVSNVKVADLSSMIDTITQVAPGKLVITGGEPLLYPKLISNIINYFRFDYRQHWDIVLCSNLCFPELSKDQLDVIRHCDYIQTTYSTDRFGDNQTRLNWVKNNICKIKSLQNSDVKKVDAIVTVTDKTISMMDGGIIDFVNDSKIDGILFENFTFFTPDPLLNIQQFYRVADEYILNMCKYLKDKVEILNFSNWKMALDNHMILHCNVCDSGYCKEYRVDHLRNGCTCCVNTNKKDRQYKFTHHCINCEYYKYCMMDCERFGKYCAFPKKTFKYFLDNIYKKEECDNV